MKNATRYIPKDSTPIHFEDVAAVVYVYDLAGKLYGVAYSGKRSKNDWHHSFVGGEVSLNKHIDEYIAGLRSSVARKAAELAKRKAFKHTLEVGSILVCSWGYDQTNVDFYQVVELVGDKSVKVREIAQTREETGYMTGTCVAVADSFTGDAMLKKVNEYNSIKIASYASASLWNGKAKRWSSYA